MMEILLLLILGLISYGLIIVISYLIEFFSWLWCKIFPSTIMCPYCKINIYNFKYYHKNICPNCGLSLDNKIDKFKLLDEEINRTKSLNDLIDDLK